ncbi:Non-histone chromosomal protein 6 [Zancudomyces culisetae]|nr:Non-histone chromosomal protein 6 [Zancudomyces culisetae]|eukprot:OMH83636.1 Non-histone chromosomal protein 6 [Zancudomyces culisetae]
MFDMLKYGPASINNGERDPRRSQIFQKPPHTPSERYQNDYVDFSDPSAQRGQFAYTLQPPAPMNQGMFVQPNSISSGGANVLQDQHVYYPDNQQHSHIFNIERQSNHMMAGQSYQPIGSHVSSISVAPYKRKYKKHPKRDPNAPEKWKSAYQLFREDLNRKLENQKLSFVSLSKIHSEQWSKLDSTKKKYYDDLAKNAKEDYEKKMAVYKQSKQFKEYQEYLNQFYLQEDTVGRVGRPKGKKAANNVMLNQEKNRYANQVLPHNFNNFSNVDH